MALNIFSSSAFRKVPNFLKILKRRKNRMKTFCKPPNTENISYSLLFTKTYLQNSQYFQPNGSVLKEGLKKIGAAM